jgi:hypothetical protein
MELFSMVLTFYALFASDVRDTAPSTALGGQIDTIIGILTLMTAILFTLETALNTWVWKGYFLGTFFWLDIVATISLYGEVPSINDALFGTAPIAPGRAARVGTHMGRILRLVRLVRVFRLVRLVSSAKERMLKEKQQRVRVEQQQRLRSILEAQKQTELENSLVRGNGPGMNHIAQAMMEMKEMEEVSQ